MQAKDFIVVGGGIAGLSTVHYLAAQGSVCLLEQEAVLGAHSSGRNAAIYRPLEEDATTGWLSKRGMEVWYKLLGPDVLRKTGLLLVSAEKAPIESLAAIAKKHCVSHRVFFHRAALCPIAPSLESGEVNAGVFVTEGGVLDIHAMLTALEASAKKRGADIRTGSAVIRIIVTHGRIQGVELSDGTLIKAPVVVIAAGAWSERLGRSCGAGLPLVALRRHLVQLALAKPLPSDHPVVWRIEQEVYFRPESGGALASPCDEQLHEPCEPTADPRALELLAAKLSRLAPPLGGAAVRRSWACLRTFAPDRELVAGADPRVEGLYWLGALGGRGMSVALAVGELIGDLVAGRNHPLAQALSPARLLR
jgi:D-arginine dehydrogenase